MTTRADLLHRADELDDEALLIRWDHPVEARTLTRIARELRDMSTHLPPQPQEAP